MKSVRGVGEWAGYSYNCGVGCSHMCRYCFSRSFFVNEGIVASNEEFRIERPNRYKINITQRVDKAIQFPSAHDISPAYLDVYCQTLYNILVNGNKVLLVSKPHFECIEHICREFQAFKPQMEFRFSIGSLNPELTAYWEPGAPTPEERVRSLLHATEQGYQTSVSMEPILAGREDAVATFNELAPLTNGTIWIGMMNGLNERMVCENSTDRAALERISQFQTADEMLALYQELYGMPQVRWKDSINTIVRYR
jgi:DNA repair photolyase